MRRPGKTTRGLIAASVLGTTLQFGGCDLGEFQTTSTVTLDGREVVTFLIQAAILTPIQDLVERGVNNFFDNLEGDDGK